MLGPAIRVVPLPGAASMVAPVLSETSCPPSQAWMTWTRPCLRMTPSPSCAAPPGRARLVRVTRSSGSPPSSPSHPTPLNRIGKTPPESFASESFASETVGAPPRRQIAAVGARAAAARPSHQHPSAHSAAHRAIPRPGRAGPGRFAPDGAVRVIYPSHACRHRPSRPSGPAIRPPAPSEPSIRARHPPTSRVTLHPSQRPALHPSHPYPSRPPSESASGLPVLADEDAAGRTRARTHAHGQ